MLQMELWKLHFSDGVRDIVNGDMPKDVFTNPNILSEFELENNGVIVSSNDSNFSIDAFVFNVNDYNNDIFLDPKIGTLLMSSSLKVKYKTIGMISNFIRCHVFFNYFAVYNYLRYFFKEWIQRCKKWDKL